MRKLFTKLLITAMVLLGATSVTPNDENVEVKQVAASEETISTFSIVTDPGGGRT
jgi:hypothetical protein